MEPSTSKHPVVKLNDYLITGVDTDPVTGNRFYTDGKEKYVSVTSLLKHFEDLTTLYNWQERVGMEEADRISNESRDIGTLSHSQIEHYLQHQEVKEDFTSYSLNTIEAFYKRTDPILYEKTIMYEDPLLPIRYAGTFDQLLYLKEEFRYLQDPTRTLVPKYVISDLKTKRKAVRLDRADYIFKYCLQLAAYVYALNYIQDDIKVEGGVVVIATKQTVKLLFLDRMLISYYWDIFYRMLLDYYFIEPINMTWKEMVDEASMYFDEETSELTSKLPYIIF